MINKNILIATGGTGGHIFPALSLANYLRNKNYFVQLTTDKRGLKYLGDKNSLNIIKIPSSPLLKKNIFKLLYSLLIIFLSTLRSLILLIFKRPSLVIGMGGYSSFPICLAALILRIKFIIYENNLIIGKANKYLLPFAENILVSYKEIEGISHANSKKIIEIGNLIREEIINSNLKKDEFDSIKILVLGGSQAAKIFAEKLPEIFKKIKDEGVSITIIQQCQSGQIEKLSEFYNRVKIDHELFSFTNKILEYYSKVNLVITRSGASVLGELINTRTPFIAIPLPTSADNHQYKNAKYYEKRGFGYLIEEKNISSKLYDLLRLIIKDKTKNRKIISFQSQYSDKDIFKRLIITIDKIINEKN